MIGGAGTAPCHRCLVVSHERNRGNISFVQALICCPVAFAAECRSDPASSSRYHQRPGKPLLQKDPDSLRSPDPQHYTTGAWPACSAGTVSAVSGGRVNWNTAPRGSFADAHNRPPCASMIERQIARPMPRPSGLVV